MDNNDEFILDKGPFKGAKITLGNRQRVSEYGQLPFDFISEVLDVEAFLLTDLTCIWDFPFESKEAVFDKIKSIYGVDVSDITNGNLCDILDRITRRPS